MQVCRGFFMELFFFILFRIPNSTLNNRGERGGKCIPDAFRRICLTGVFMVDPKPWCLDKCRNRERIRTKEAD